MPVQRFNSAPVNRPPGLVEPQVERHGLTELRLHGVGGTTPENLLGDLAPQQVHVPRVTLEGAVWKENTGCVGRTERDGL